MSELFELLEPIGSRTLVNLQAQAEDVSAALSALESVDAGARLWAREGSLWAGDDRTVAREVRDRLGWLDLPRDMRVDVPRLKALATEVKAAGITRVVLLGMGGSSLAPETMAAVLPTIEAGCELCVLDSTDPAQIQRVEQQAPLDQTLFVLASKSGTTAETDSLYAYFKARLIDELGKEEWSAHFVAITDPGTKLARLAARDKLRATYLNPPDIGGRYSALSLYGLAPAALAGVDLDRLLLAAQEMAWACRSTVPISENPGAVLGAIMGGCARAGALPVDKLALLTSPRMAAFGPWAEQLIAESTGKAGVGIVPVEGEDLASANRLSRDRLFVYLRLEGDDNEAVDALAVRLVGERHPLAVLTMAEPYALGAELFRWEFATAIAGRLLGINPFDQPDVESAKARARQAISDYEETHELRQLPVLLTQDGLRLSGLAVAADDLASHMAALFGRVTEGQYVALMAYVDRSAPNIAALQALRGALLTSLHVPVTLGFGPRFLHSTGQLHKGGPNTGLFIQIAQDETADLSIPERSYSFGVLKAAQALGDWEALQEAGRTAVHVNIGADVAAGLDELGRLVGEALRQMEGEA
jgi:glucose-6-phosphate isomerase